MKKAITIIILTCLFLLLGTLVFVKYEENASIKLVEKQYKKRKR